MSREVHPGVAAAAVIGVLAVAGIAGRGYLERRDAEERGLGIVRAPAGTAAGGPASGPAGDSSGAGGEGDAPRSQGEAMARYMRSVGSVRLTYRGPRNDASAPEIRILSPEGGSRSAAGDALEVAYEAAGSGAARYVAALDARSPVLAEGGRVRLSAPGPGEHVVRIAPVGPDGRLLNQERVAVRRFGGGGAEGAARPVVTLVAPNPLTPLGEGESAPLDFHLANVDLGRSHRLRLIVDGERTELQDWGSWALDGLKPGRHRLKLQLLDAAGRPLSHPGASSETEFVVSGGERPGR